VTQRFPETDGVPDREACLAENKTRTFLVIHDRWLVHDGDLSGTHRDSIATSSSLAESFASVTIGLAMQAGHSESIDDPVTKHLPEWASRDPRFGAITLRQRLLMSSRLGIQGMRKTHLEGDEPLNTQTSAKSPGADADRRGPERAFQRQHEPPPTPGDGR
jgi:CubicO group peptidase (beta-lactamase class C family)